MFECDTLWCCWLLIVEGIGRLLWALRYVFAGYALIYVAGAAFLTTLRVQSPDGKLVVRRDSLAYAVAHPMIYGGHREPKSDTGSICTFYARMLNMLLFVWPVLVLYFIIVCGMGSVLMFLLFGAVLIPNLHEDGYIEKLDSPIRMGFFTFPVAAIILLVFFRRPVFVFLSVTAWVIACLIPLIAVAVTGILVRRKMRDPDSETASVMKEAFAAKKDRYCKMVEFK